MAIVTGEFAWLKRLLLPLCRTNLKMQARMTAFAVVTHIENYKVVLPADQATVADRDPPHVA